MEFGLWGRNVTNNLFNTLYVRFNKRLNQSVCVCEGDVDDEQEEELQQKETLKKRQTCGKSTLKSARRRDALDKIYSISRRIFTIILCDEL